LEHLSNSAACSLKLLRSRRPLAGKAGSRKQPLAAKLIIFFRIQIYYKYAIIFIN